MQILETRVDWQVWWNTGGRLERIHGIRVCFKCICILLACLIIASVFVYWCVFVNCLCLCTGVCLYSRTLLRQTLGDPQY